MPREGSNPAGKRPSSRNAKPYDANNVSSLATTGDRRGTSVSVAPTAAGRGPFAPSFVTRVARRSDRRRAPTPRRMVSRMPALFLRRGPPTRYPRYVSEPDDNLNLIPVPVSRAGRRKTSSTAEMRPRERRASARSRKSPSLISANNVPLRRSFSLLRVLPPPLLI